MGKSAFRWFSFSALIVLSTINPGCKNRDLAYQHIREMKDGVAIVRLKTSVLKYDKLIEMGENERATQVIADQREDNLRIMAAFKKFFNFSPVYFFYSSNSNKVRQHRYEDIFLTDSLEIDPNLTLSSDNVFVVDIGYIEIETFRSGTEGISVRNTQFELMKKPFPYWVKDTKSNIEVFNKSVEVLVIMLNERLKIFYQRALK